MLHFDPMNFNADRNRPGKQERDSGEGNERRDA